MENVGGVTVQGFTIILRSKNPEGGDALSARGRLCFPPFVRWEASALLSDYNLLLRWASLAYGLEVRPRG